MKLQMKNRDNIHEFNNLIEVDINDKDELLAKENDLNLAKAQIEEGKNKINRSRADLEEAKKCILVCANCHREIHTSNIYENIDLWKYQIYNNDYAMKLIEDTKQEEKEYKCSKCGVKITRYSKSGLCPSCVQLGKRVVENRPDREELKKLIREMPFTKIAELYGCSDNAVRKWCDKENLPRKKADIEQYTDEQWSKI